MNVDPQETYFIDINILVYAYDRSAGKKHEAAVELMKACWEHENGRLSIQVLQEFFVTVTRKIASPLDLLTARQIVADLAR
jgi:predicted nucleic acid-binding protein